MTGPKFSPTTKLCRKNSHSNMSWIFLHPHHVYLISFYQPLVQLCGLCEAVPDSPKPLQSPALWIAISNSCTKPGALSTLPIDESLKFPVTLRSEAPCSNPSSPTASGPVPSTWKLLHNIQFADWFFQWPSLMCSNSINKWAGDHVSQLSLDQPKMKLGFTSPSTQTYEQLCLDP